MGSRRLLRDDGMARSQGTLLGSRDCRTGGTRGAYERLVPRPGSVDTAERHVPAPAAKQSSSTKTNQRPRRAIDGDRSPVLTPAGIEAHEVAERTERARSAMLESVRDILLGASGQDRATIAHWLAAVVKGTSSDDAAELRGAVVQPDSSAYGVPPIDPDDQLVSNRAAGAYPYVNLLSRKSPGHCCA